MLNRGLSKKSVLEKEERRSDMDVIYIDWTQQDLVDLDAVFVFVE